MKNKILKQLKVMNIKSNIEFLSRKIPECSSGKIFLTLSALDFLMINPKTPELPGIFCKTPGKNPGKGLYRFCSNPVYIV